MEVNENLNKQREEQVRERFYEIIKFALRSIKRFSLKLPKLERCVAIHEFTVLRFASKKKETYIWYCLLDIGPIL